MKRAEHLRQFVRRNAHPGVDHVQNHARALGAADQRERAALRHRLLRVQHQVQQRLFKEVGVERHRRQFAVREPVQLHVLLLRGGAEEVDEPHHDRVEARGGEPRLAGPREPQEVVRQIDQLAALGGQFADARERAALARRFGRLEVFGEQLQVEREGTEVVLDFVNEPGREFRGLGRQLARGFGHISDAVGWSA